MKTEFNRKMDVRTRQESDPASDWNKVKMESRSPSKGLNPTSLILDSSSAKYFVEVTVKSYENISIVDQNTLNLTQFESRSRVLLSIGEQI